MVYGRRVGLDVRTVDLHLTLAAGETRSVDLRNLRDMDFEPGPLPPVDMLGVPTIGGTDLRVVRIDPDGAGWLAHLRGRITPHVVADLWALHSPGSGYARGELMVTASTTLPHDPSATLPDDLRLEWGGALALVPGAPSSGLGPLLHAGDQIGDGQALTWPVCIVWPRLMRAQDWTMASAQAELGISTNGIGQLWPQGNPQVPAGFDRLAWTRRNRPDAIASLHRWAPPKGLGVAAYTRSTGAQEEQVFVGGKTLGVQGLGAETVRYLVAQSQSRRPCQYREPDGDLLRLSEHPCLAMWDGALHWDVRQSTDRLGRTRNPNQTETQGWYGPDTEHWLMGSLYVAYRQFGSPAIQAQLAAQGRLYLLQWTVDPKLATSSPGPARAVGWEGIGVVILWHSLDDRDLAAAVRDRWLARVDRVLIPRLGSTPIWHVIRNDPRLGDGEWWFPWQQSVGPYGVDWGGETFGHAGARALALCGAEYVLEHGWRRVGDGWSPVPQMPVAGGDVPNDSSIGFGLPAMVRLRDSAHGDILSTPGPPGCDRSVGNPMGPEGGDPTLRPGGVSLSGCRGVPFHAAVATSRPQVRTVVRRKIIH
jgi:hypothetical protein